MLLHHCEVIAINGPSYRLKNRLAAVETTINSATARAAARSPREGGPLHASSYADRDSTTRTL